MNESKSLISAPNSCSSKTEPRNDFREVKSSGNEIKKSLFEKLSASMPIKAAPRESPQNVSNPDVNKQNQSLIEQASTEKVFDNKYPTYNKKNVHYNSSIEEESNLVYRPGVGITQGQKQNGSRKGKSPLKTGNLSKSFLNSSLDFHDPYNNSIPVATSPSKTNLDETLEPHHNVHCFDKDHIPSSQESNDASLIIEENNAVSESDDEILLSESEPEELDHISDDNISTFQEVDNRRSFNEIISPEKNGSPETNKASEDVQKLNPPTKLDFKKTKAISDNSEQDDEVFGSLSVSPVKVKNTFGKKKSPDVVAIDLIQLEEEDKIMESEFKKNMNPQNTEKPILVEESPVKINIPSSQGSEYDSGNDSDKDQIKNGSEEDAHQEINRKKHRAQKLEEIKNLKARIFEKQWKQSKQDSSSSSSESSESDSESSESKSDSNDSDFSCHSIANVSNEKSQNSDSDVTINSNESVESETEVLTSNHHSSANNSESDSYPKRKRKKLSSPSHCNENDQKLKTLKPVIALTPKQLQEKRLKSAQKCRKLPCKMQIPEIQPPLRKNAKNSENSKDAATLHKQKRKEVDKTKKIDVEFIRSLKESKEFKEKRQNRPSIEQENTVISKQNKNKHRDPLLKRKLEDQKINKESKNKKEDPMKSLPKIPRKTKLKPGVSANIKSDQIIPHQRKLSERKLKIMAKYDQRMDSVNNYVDNAKTFYQKSAKSESASLNSKYKKEVFSFK